MLPPTESKNKYLELGLTGTPEAAHNLLLAPAPITLNSLEFVPKMRAEIAVGATLHCLCSVASYNTRGDEILIRTMPQPSAATLPIGLEQHKELGQNMKRLEFVALASALVLLTASHYSESQEFAPPSPPSWVIHRDQNGRIDKADLNAAREVLRKATQDGYVTLWLLIDERHTLIATYSDEDYLAKCIDIIRPLVKRGLVWHPTNGPTNTGPVCLVRASTAGVAILLQDKRLEQIMASNPPFAK